MSSPDPAVFDQKPWLALTPRDLGPARRVPTMLHMPERKLYLWLTSVWASGAGAVVDLGCFAGGSTALLAQGLKRAGLPGPVHAYDAFTIAEPLKEKYLYPAGIAPFEGEDMLPAARELLAPWAGRVAFHPGRIERQGWDGGAIEILVMDASKTAETMDRMADIFFPHLIPGRSVVVQQDFLHWKQPWVAVQMERMSDAFRPVAHAPRDTVAFLCERRPDAAAIGRGRCAALTDAEMIESLDRMRERMRGFGVGRGLKTLAAAVRLNPGRRAAAGFRTAPPQDDAA